MKAPAASRPRPSAGGRTRNTRSRRKPARNSPVGIVVTTLFGLVGLGMLLLVLAPDLQARSQRLAMAASFAPYGWICWLVALIIGLVSTRRRLAVLPLALGLAVHSFLLLPYLPGAPSAVAGQRATLGVLELNLRYGQADTAGLAAEVDRRRPDVVVLAEVTNSTLKALSTKAWQTRLPYRIGTTDADADPATGFGGAGGTMILSRFALTDLGRAQDTEFTNLAVRVAMPEHPFVLVGAHPANPEHGLSRWLQDGQSLAALASAHTSEPLVVAGDLNATAEHLTLRELKARAGLTDTATGRGWHPTFPADTWYPPLIQIDHVLASSEFTTTGLDTFSVPGTDHRGLMVQLRVS